MRARTLGMWVLVTLGVAACGGGAHFADGPRPALPINVSVYVNDQRVSVAPNSVTPGYVTFTIANVASGAEAVEVTPAGGSAPITTTAPINPQATDKVTLDLSSAGQYNVAIAPASSTEAAAATPSGIQPGLLTVQGRRGNSNNQLLQP
jgi:hypothetical protein